VPLKGVAEEVVSLASSFSLPLVYAGRDGKIVARRVILQLKFVHPLHLIIWDKLGI